MSTAPPSRSPVAVAAELSRYLVVVFVFYFIATYLVGAATRLLFPYALEWTEGSVVDEIARVVDGLAIYVAPSVDYVPQLQTPLYFWISAGFAQVLGIDFAAPRVVSLLATLGCMAALYGFVWRETRSRQTALLAAALYAATYQLSGSWFDLAQVDSLGLLFMLLAGLALRHANAMREQLLGAGLLAAAFFTDQVYGIAVVALCLHCALTGRGGRRLIVPAVSLGLIAAGSALADRTSGGWFGFYVFDVPWAHFALGAGGARAFAEAPGHGSFVDDLAAPLPVLALLAVGFVLHEVKARRAADTSFALLFAVGLLGTSWFARDGLGADRGSLMPAYAVVALYAALAVHALPAMLRESVGPATARRGALAELAVHVLCILQLVVLVYDPGAEMPGDADREEGARTVDLMQQIDGEIWSPAHGGLPRRAGHAPSAHLAALVDVLDAGGPVADRLSEEVEEALAEQRFVAIYAPIIGFEQPLRGHYVQSRMGSPRGDLRYPRGHETARARDVYLPRHREEAED